MHGRAGDVAVDGHGGGHGLVTTDLNCGGTTDRVAHGDGALRGQLALVGASLTILLDDPVQRVRHLALVAWIVGAAVEHAGADDHVAMGSKAEQQA